MAPLNFTIPGKLPGKKRAGRRFVGGEAVQTYNPPATANAEALVRWYAAGAMRAVDAVMLTGAISLVVQVWRVPPKSWSKKKRAARSYVTGKPDCDNTLKLIADSLNGIVWRDDAQIAAAHFIRRFTETCECECVDITIEELEPA